MIRFDTLKILIPKEYYKLENSRESSIWTKRTFKEKRLISQSINEETMRFIPGVNICTINARGELIFEFSSKILMNNYSDLLTFDNIKIAYCFLKQVEVKMDYNHFLEKSSVCRVHISLNIHSKIQSDDLISAFKKISIKNDRYDLNSYNKKTLNMSKNKSEKHKINITIYDKANCLKDNSSDKNFLKWLSKNNYNKDQVIENHKGILRLEQRIKNFKQMRKIFKIKDNNLISVLQSKEEHILSNTLKDIINPELVEKVNKEYKEKIEKHNLKELKEVVGMLAIGIVYDFDVEKACRNLKKYVKIEKYEKNVLKDNFQVLKNYVETLKNPELIKLNTLEIMEKVYQISKDQDLLYIKEFYEQVEKTEIS